MAEKQNNAKLKIWGRGSSINVQKVLWLAAELGLEFEHIPAGGRYGRLDEPEFIALNPFRHVPVIEDGKTSVWESHAILRYLAAKYGAPHFWHKDPAVRSQADRWMDWAQVTLQPVFMGLFGSLVRTPAPQRNPQAIQRGIVQSGRMFGVLDRLIEDRPFLSGDDITLADIPAGTMLYRYFELAIERPSLPKVEAWYARLSERPAFQTHVMSDFSELRA